jgi:hypothetical protein
MPSGRGRPCAALRYPHPARAPRQRQHCPDTQQAWEQVLGIGLPPPHLACLASEQSTTLLEPTHATAPDANDRFQILSPTPSTSPSRVVGLDDRSVKGLGLLALDFEF